MGLAYIVDTNVVSELMTASPSQSVIDWFWDHEGEVYLNAITVKELYYGMERLPDGKRKETLRNAIDGVASDCAGKTFAFDSYCGFNCARLQQKSVKAGFNVSIEDLMIAAIALRNDAVLATRNTKDFAHLDVRLVNPFEDATGA